ncbi:MAG: RNA polymerase sigma factor [Rikenellaceae bacterium]|nr:RNA polymerase sigma factor [Rikenellaceae bacterium]
MDDVIKMIAQLRSNTVEAFDRLIEQYGDRLYWHIRRVVIRHEETEDILQETFMRAFLSISHFRGDTERSLTAWLYKIATTLAIKSLNNRKKGLFSSIDSVRGELLTTFEEEMDPSADEIIVRLQKAVLALPTKQRLVFNMRYYDELSFEQISQVTGQSITTLKTNYHYAAKKIKEQVSTIDWIDYE